MTEQDKHQLLAAIFGEDELAQVRQTTLLRGLQEMRRRRQRAVAVRVCVMAFPALLLAAMVLQTRSRMQPQASPPMATSMAPNSPSKVKYITADQLFALFPNRSMALVGKPGHQQLIFLDKQAGGSL